MKTAAPAPREPLPATTETVYTSEQTTSALAAFAQESIPYGECVRIGVRMIDTTVYPCNIDVNFTKRINLRFTRAPERLGTVQYSFGEPQNIRNVT